MDQIISWVLEHLNYWVVMLFMAIESSFIPFPSEVVVPPAAWLATVSDELNIVLVVIFATLGADIGALVNYYLALWLGRPVVYRLANSRLGRICLIDEEKIQQAEKFFQKHGVISTLVGRLVPGVRQLISIPAGLSKMHLGKFLLYTTIGAGLWNIVLALIGYFLAQVPGLNSVEAVVEKAYRYSHLIGYALMGMALLIVVYFVYKATSSPKKSSEE